MWQVWLCDSLLSWHASPGALWARTAFYLREEAVGWKKLMISFAFTWRGMSCKLPAVSARPKAEQKAGQETRCVLKGEWSAWRVLSVVRQKTFWGRDVCVSNIFVSRDIWRWEIAPRALRKWRVTALSKKGKGEARPCPCFAGKTIPCEDLMNSRKEGSGRKADSERQTELSLLMAEKDQPLSLWESSGVTLCAPVLPGARGVLPQCVPSWQPSHTHTGAEPVQDLSTGNPPEPGTALDTGQGSTGILCWQVQQEFLEHQTEQGSVAPSQWPAARDSSMCPGGVSSQQTPNPSPEPRASPEPAQAHPHCHSLPVTNP